MSALFLGHVRHISRDVPQYEMTDSAWQLELSSVQFSNKHQRQQGAPIWPSCEVQIDFKSGPEVPKETNFPSGFVHQVKFSFSQSILYLNFHRRDNTIDSGK